jgi:hypothetical protein
MRLRGLGDRGAVRFAMISSGFHVFATSTSEELSRRRGLLRRAHVVQAHRLLFTPVLRSHTDTHSHTDSCSLLCVRTGSVHHRSPLPRAALVVAQRSAQRSSLTHMALDMARALRLSLAPLSPHPRRRRPVHTPLARISSKRRSARYLLRCERLSFTAVHTPLARISSKRRSARFESTLSHASMARSKALAVAFAPAWRIASK